MSKESLTIDPSRMNEDEWLTAIQTYVRTAKDAGEVVSLHARPEFLSPEQAGERLSMSRTTVVRAINAGELRAVKVGNRHRIPLIEVDNYRRRSLNAILEEFYTTMDELGIPRDAPVPDDPVSVYDNMREAANRLGGMRLHLSTTRAERDAAIAVMRAEDDEVNAVPPYDMEAQKSMTAELDRRYDALVQR
jgi:excisionase family DNA binding protein